VSMFRLYLVAHAPTAAQRLPRFPADEGIEPVDTDVTRRLAARLGRCDAVWCGPERRAVETAAALGLGATPCAELGAWSCGVWAGRELLWVAERDPEGFRAWRTDPDWTPPGGESLRALTVRAAGWLDARATDSGRAILIADATVIRALLVRVLGAGPEAFWRLDIPPLSLSVVQHAGDHWRLRGLGIDYGFMPGEAAEGL
jgi:broad specificity phosphatase PhoE